MRSALSCVAGINPKEQTMLVTILIVLILLALALYGTSLLPMLDRRIVVLIQIVLVVIAIIYIAQKAGIA